MNQTWVHSPLQRKVNLLTLGCGEGKCGIYCRASSKESRQLVLESPELLEGSQGKLFKDRMRKRERGA